MNTHRNAPDHIGVTGIQVPTRHGDVIVNLSICASRKGGMIRATAVVGDDTSPGWRLKDGAGDRRKEVAEDVARAIGIDLKLVSIQAAYSRLGPLSPDGMIEDRNTGGYYRV
jgi:hypothetical protein